MTGDGRPVSDIGERGLLERLRTRLPRPPEGEIWSGDDAAVVAGQVITTDVIVENVDFRLSTFGPADIGWKALAINVSDIAAMGATPQHAVATVTMPREITVETFDGIAEGLLELAGAYHVALVGGDISEGPTLSVGATVIGRAGERVVTRSGAQVGDAICVTGSLGGAAGGLIALEQGIDAHELIERQRRPRPRVKEGLALANVATSMIDVSDGLAVDLGHIVEASGVGCSVDHRSIPVDPNLEALEEDAVRLAISGGEDFELLFTTAEIDAVPIDFTQIGVITEAEARIGDAPLAEWRKKGWDHLRDR